MAERSQGESSLEELEQQSWGLVPGDATGLVAKVHELRRKPVGVLTAEDLRMLIGQRVGLDVLVPRAVELLRAEPLMTADLYPGDLLAAVLRVPRSYWRNKPELANAINGVIESIQEIPNSLHRDIRGFQLRDETM